MLSNSTILLSQAIIDSSSDYKVPMVVSKGMFPIKLLDKPWQSTNVLYTDYSMSYDRFVGTHSDDNVVPVVNAKSRLVSALSGIAEVQILYHDRYDDSFVGNSNVMHKSQVSSALVEINKNLSRKVDIAIFNGYVGDGIKGIYGLNDYGLDIGSSPLDPSDYPAVYAFFGEAISYMTQTLNVPASSINLFIGREAVMAMDSVMLSDGNGQSIWQRLKGFILSEVTIFVLDSYLLGNQCRFVARNYSALCKPNMPFFMPQAEKPADGNKQFVIYVEYVLPSLVITDSSACLKQDDLFILPEGISRSLMQKRSVQEAKPNKTKEEKTKVKPMRRIEETTMEFN